MSKVCGLLNGAFRIAWGFVYDALGFKIPYSIVTALQIIVSATFYSSAKYIWSYYITNILENVVFSGHGTIAPPIVSKIFGMKNTVTLIGITGYYIGTAGFVGAVIGKLIIKKDSDFLIVYLIGCGFAVMGFIICLFTKEDKFKYVPIDKEKKDIDNEQKEMDNEKKDTDNEQKDIDNEKKDIDNEKKDIDNAIKDMDSEGKLNEILKGSVGSSSD